MKNWEKFTSISSLIVAIAAVIVAITANGIAHRSYEIAYQTNLPVISAISTVHYDVAEDLMTEEIVVNNEGFPLTEFHCSADAILEIGPFRNETYVPLGGYFGIVGDYTGSSKGLLASMSEEGNYSLFSSVRRDFWKEASKDESQDFIWLSNILILSVSYKDYTQTSRKRYYSVDSSGSNEISAEYAWEILHSAYANRELMESEGLNCYMSALNGTELWHWYKGKYLE
jgi:hypothetical protein